MHWTDSQDHRPAIRRHGAWLPAGRLSADAADAMAAGVADLAAAPGRSPTGRRGQRAERLHGCPSSTTSSWRCTARVMIFLAVVPLLDGRVWQLPRAAADWRAATWRFRDSTPPATGSTSPRGVLMLASFFIEGGAANSGWTSYPPLAIFATRGPGLLADRHLPARPLVDAERASTSSPPSCSCAPPG